MKHALPFTAGARARSAANTSKESEVIEVVLADREEAKRILKEENVAIMCSYHLMHFIHDEEPFAFLK